MPSLGRLRALGPGFNRVLVGLYKRMGRGWSEPVRALRRELGLPPGRDPIFEGQHSPRGVLGLFSREFGAPQPDWPPATRVCGFLFRDSDFGGRGMDPALERFLAAGPPPVVFTLGSSAVLAADGFYRDASEAARALGARAVLVAGPGAAAMGDLPPGQVAVPSAPYHRLFPAAAAVVHSGGIGTIAQALRAGRPQVVVPFAHDQFDNADRVARLGLGRRLLRRRVSAAGLAAALRPLLADAALRARAEEVGRRVSAEDGPGAACAAVEEALAGG
jgi:UDP:flavonoid glycosyltransferase YjiC (YdhE family)